MAHLDGVDLRGAHLEGTNLRSTRFDGMTMLNNATLDAATKLGDIQWGAVGAVNLTQIDWSHVPYLGDEPSVKRRDTDFELRQAVRAYGQLAAHLRAQGMSEAADRFAYRAQICQRAVFLERRCIPQWLGSWTIAALAGYGFRPGRTILWYLTLITAFAIGYYLLGPTQGHAFQPDGALVFSVTSFHGRGFFPESLSFESWVTRLAALEAVLGLLIEVSFIATFTQRFFAR